MTRPAFEDRFDRLAAIAYRIGFRLLGDREDAREVVQETLARAFARWRRVSAYDEPWVARVATNLAIDRCRKRRPTVPIEDHDSGPAADGVARVLDRHELIASLGQLPARQRDVVVLRYLADLPERDVASALGISVGSVKQHTHRAIARLRAELAPIRLEVDDVRASR